MKFMGVYDDCLHPVAQHIAELCRHFNYTGFHCYIDMLKGVVNMAHTFGLGCTVFQAPGTTELLFVAVHDYSTDEVIVMGTRKDICEQWYNCRAVMSRTQHSLYSEGVFS